MTPVRCLFDILLFLSKASQIPRKVFLQKTRSLNLIHRSTDTITSRNIQTLQNDQASSTVSSMDVKQDSVEPVAVIGFSSTFPQDATSPEAFWQMLMEGRSAMTKVPHDRFNIDAFCDHEGTRLDTVRYYKSVTNIIVQY